MLLLFFAGNVTAGAGPAVADYKRIPNVPRLASIPTLNRKKLG